MEFEKVKTITLPLVKFGVAPKFVEITSLIYTGEKISGGTAAQQAMEPPDMAHCIDLETGEEGLMMLGKVLKSEIEKAYPEGAYVGKCFSIAKKNAPEGKKYALWQLDEIKVVGKTEAKKK